MTVTIFAKALQAADVDRAATAAREAFEHSPWRTMPLSERCAKIRRMADIILERKEELARLEVSRCWEALCGGAAS